MTERLQQFQFLDALRESGTVNMMAGGGLLADAFGLSRADARKVFADWMTSFDPDVLVEDRAQQVSA